MKSLLVAFLCFVSLYAFAGGAAIEVTQGYSGGNVTIKKVALFTVGKSGYAPGAIGTKDYNKACEKHGCLQIRTEDDRRCYISNDDLKDQGIDPVQLGTQLIDEKSTVWISCYIKPIEAKYIHGIATHFSINSTYFSINSGNEKKDEN